MVRRPGGGSSRGDRGSLCLAVPAARDAARPVGAAAAGVRPINLHSPRGGAAASTDSRRHQIWSELSAPSRASRV